jgi:choline dehydrogenase-like flavoprotein
MPYDFDVIVIGSGAGGGTLAYACAAAGKAVLLVERGRHHPSVGQAHDERAMLIEKQPYDDRAVQVNGRLHRLYTGGVLGGGTALFGAALMRPSAIDFHPGRSYGQRIPRAIWDWPVDYGVLEPYYTQAESLFGVAGCGGDDFGPLERPRHGFPRPTIPLHPINQRLAAANRARGLKPFHLPLAIDFGRCLQCGVCPGYICPTGARRSAAQVVQESQVQHPRLQVLTHVEAESLCRNGDGQIDGIRLRHRTTGERVVYRARRYALAAGAIGSPILLLRSGVSGPLIGRHYMFHLSPISAGIFRQQTAADGSFVKQLGFADFYLGTRRFPDKLGVIQSLPVPGPLMLAKAGARRLPSRLLEFLRKRMLWLVGIVEDLPNPANRVSLVPDGTPRLRHLFAPYDLERGQRLSRFMKQILKRAGAALCLSKTFPSHEHVAHHCGTLRFGTRPENAVADAECRMFGHPNVFIVDGSVFPTSLGVGPALTIIANALRVARVVVKEI